MFDKNTYINENDKITLTPEQKNIIKAAMYRAEDEQKASSRPRRTRKIPVWARTTAVAMAAVLAVGGAWLGFGSPKNSDNVFSITASAAEATPDERISTERGGLLVGAFSCGSESGGFMTVNPQADREDGNQYYKDGFYDYFADYSLRDLKIKGKNIVKVELSTNKKGLYFSIESLDNITRDAEDRVYVDNKLTDYKDRREAELADLAKFTDKDSLTHSQYTRREFDRHCGFLGWVCDGFTYENKNPNGKVQSVLPKNNIYLELESDHSVPEIAELVKALEKEYHGSVAEWNRLAKEIQKKMLSDAAIEIKATFTDGSTETRRLNLSYAGDGQLRLTLDKPAESENSFTIVGNAREGKNILTSAEAKKSGVYDVLQIKGLQINGNNIKKITYTAENALIIPGKEVELKNTKQTTLGTAGTEFSYINEKEKNEDSLTILSEKSFKSTRLTLTATFTDGTSASKELALMKGTGNIYLLVKE